MLTSGSVLDRYEVLAEIGSGELASVRVARLQSIAGFERLVALKLLHPPQARDGELVSMLLEEARLAACVRHPNLVSTLDVQSRDGDVAVVVDYIEGVSLRTLLQQAGNQRLRIAVAVRILVDALYAVQAVHQGQSLRGEPLRLLHRDISSQNLLLGTDGVTRLSNLGLAGAQMKLFAKRQRRLQSKLPYVAPEVIEGGEIDQQADLYSLGVVLWETLTGQRLLRAGGDASHPAVTAQEPLPRVSRIVAELAPFEALLDRALARSVTARFQTAEPFLEALERTAQRIGVGVASSREVAKVVQTLAADKLAAERHKLASAAASLPKPAASLGTAHTIAAPTTSASIAVARLSQQTLPRSLHPNLVGNAVAKQPQRPMLLLGKRRMLVVLAGLAAVLAVIASLGLLLRKPDVPATKKTSDAAAGKAIAPSSPSAPAPSNPPTSLPSDAAPLDEPVAQPAAPPAQPAKAPIPAIPRNKSAIVRHRLRSKLYVPPSATSKPTTKPSLPVKPLYPSLNKPAPIKNPATNKRN